MPSESPRDQRSINRYAINEPSAEPEAFPQGMIPVPENYGLTVFPYRGQETHGVDPTAMPERPAEDTEGGKVEIEYVPPQDDPPPVPVRIVDTATHEFSQWRAVQNFAGAGSPTRILDRKEGRKSATVQNMGDQPIFVGPDSTVSNISGYRLAAGATFSLEAEAEVWAVSSTVNPQAVCAYFEFATAER